MAADLAIAIYAKAEVLQAAAVPPSNRPTFGTDDRGLFSPFVLERTRVACGYLKKFVDFGITVPTRDEREALESLRSSYSPPSRQVSLVAAAITSYGAERFADARHHAEHVIESIFDAPRQHETAAAVGITHGPRLVLEVDDCLAIEAKWRLLDTLGEYGQLPEDLVAAFQTAWMIEQYDFALEMAEAFWKDLTEAQH